MFHVKQLERIKNEILIKAIIQSINVYYVSGGIDIKYVGISRNNRVHL